MLNQLCITIMAKAPQAGKVKTRLIPALGEGGAAALAQKMLQHTVTIACAAAQQLQNNGWVAEVQLCASPAPQHVAWKKLRAHWEQAEERIEWSEQCSGDLGARMQHAMVNNAELGRATVLLGMDCPSLTAQHIVTAAQALREYDVVIIPSTDGGYVLMALRTPQPALFNNIAWSTAQVLDETVQRMNQAGLSYHLLPALMDIDTPEDLKYL